MSAVGFIPWAFFPSEDDCAQPVVLIVAACLFGAGTAIAAGLIVAGIARRVGRLA